MGGVKNEQFVSETNVVSATQTSKAFNGPTGINPIFPLLGHSDTSGIGSLASGSVQVLVVQVQALCRADLTATDLPLIHHLANKLRTTSYHLVTRVLLRGLMK